MNTPGNPKPKHFYCIDKYHFHQPDTKCADIKKTRDQITLVLVALHLERKSLPIKWLR